MHGSPSIEKTKKTKFREIDRRDPKRDKSRDKSSKFSQQRDRKRNYDV